MSETPFMPLWTGDFLRKTQHLNAAESGAYLLILMAMWANNGRLTADPKKLKYAAKCGRDWPKVWAAIEPYFTVEGDQITNSRLSQELLKVASKRAAMSQNGERGGRAKALKNKELALANVSDLPEQPYPYPESEEIRKQSELQQQPSVSDGKANADAVQDGAKPADLPPHGKPRLDALEHELRQAAGCEQNPSPGLMVLAPILGLLDAGADLEGEILPAIRARPCATARTWQYFIPQIQQFRANRQAARDAPMPAAIAGQARASPGKRYTMTDAARDLLKRYGQANEPDFDNGTVIELRPVRTG